MIKAIYTLTCDKCDETGGSYQNKGALRTESKANGWRYAGYSGKPAGWETVYDMCPNCSEKMIKAKHPLM